MPLQATSGAASYDAFGGGVPFEPNYIESVFSCFLYTGNGSNRTINNGIDLSGKGGLTWIKSRNNISTVDHLLFDTARGNDFKLSSNLTAGSQNQGAGCWSPTSSGFTVNNGFQPNYNGDNYVSWTFREQPKFFDVVTYTGNGVAGRTVAHNLGSVPGVMIVKSASASGQWPVYHRSTSGTPQNDYLLLNQTAGAYINQDLIWNNTAPTSTVFTVGNNTAVNANGVTYVAYLFAHNAGGFGLTGTDNVISCGSFTTDGSGNATVNLGYEPQWVMMKRSDGVGGWLMFDNMRGLTVNTTNGDAILFANLSDAESTVDWIDPTATGFNPKNIATSATYIYIAIRRGPMKVPTTGTSVYSGVARTGTGAAATISGLGFSPDLIIGKPRTGFSVGTAQFDRLRGNSRYLAPSWTDAEITDTTMVTSFNMDGVSLGADTVQKYFNGSGGTYANWMFRRAPGFMDVCCYTGTASARTINHNLGVVPELMIVKDRTSANLWIVYQADVGAGSFLRLNADNAKSDNGGIWNSTAPTASVFSIGTILAVNTSGNAYVAYLFASCPGVQSIQSYVGDGTTGRTINCGFTSGARFVCIKATSTTGSWWTFDSARGIVTNNDPALQLNSTAAEVTSADAVDTAASGFIVNQEATCSLNASGVSYLVWAIA